MRAITKMIVGRRVFITTSLLRAATRECRDFAWTLRLWVRRGSEEKNAVA
jgi:hypothetical protein